MNIKNLQSPSGDFLLGNLKDFKSDLKHQFLENWAYEFGKVYKINLLGKKFVVSTDTDINTQILKSRPHKFRRYHKLQEIMEEMNVYGVFGSEGEDWQRFRKITAEALNVKNTRAYYNTIYQMSDRLLHKWRKYANNATVIDIQKEMVLYTVDITTQIAFGYDANTIEKDSDVMQNHLGKLFPMINSRVAFPFPIWRYFKTKKDREFEYSFHEVEKIVGKFIAEARQRLDANPALKENPTNFLESLLVQQEEYAKFTDQEIFGNVLTILLAGEDTTSNSISWAFYYLAQHKEVFEKVRQEADTIYEGEIPSTYQQVSDLKYTDAVAQEVFRLKPVASVLFMEALEDITINDLELSKGQTVILQNKNGQVDESHFTNANNFMPQRWLSDSKCPFSGVHTPDAVLTFGGGARFCPGKYLAMFEITTAISMICKNFDIELAVKPEDVKELFAFTMYPENLLIKIKPRKNS